MKKKKRVLKRILSFVLAVNLIIANACFDSIFPFNGLFNTTLTVEAYSPVITDENDAAFNADANGEVIITSLSILKDYAYHYSNSETFADKHEDDHIKLTLGASEYTIDSDYTPLGTSDHPFNGQLLFTTVNSVYTLRTYVPLFDHITDDAVIGGSVTLNLYNQATDHVLLANHVHHGSGTAVWNLYLDDTSIVDYGSSASYSGVIGEMLSNANVSLNFTDNSSTAVSNSSGDAGMICDTMQSGSKISLSLTRTSTDAFDVSSTSGNAGALVGTMHSGSSVELVKIPEASASSTVTAASDGYYAGGLVGQAEDASVVITTGGMTVGSTAGVTIIPVEGTVNASTGGAGGLFGHYINSETTFDLKDYNITATVYAKYCGGVFGVLQNNKGEGSAIALTIKNTSNTGTISTSSGTASTYESTGYYGGVAGKYTTDALTNSLILDGFSVSSTANASFDSFGGVIGIVDSAAYVKADGVSATATGSAQRDSGGFFGGLVGKTATANGVFVDLGDFTLSADSSGFKGGGVVGNINNGVLRLSGTTDMSSAKSLKGGQLVGVNDNVLVYAIGTGSNYTAAVKDAETGEITTPASGWTFKRSNSSQADDIGTWGEVVRIANIEDATNGVLTLDSANHTVTIKAAQTSMSTPSDFVKTALNIQLNQGSDYDCLQFVKDSNDVVDTSNTRTTLLASTSLSFGADISLAGTGITGFMRDGGDSVGTFTGTLAGGSKTVTLAIGEKYGKTSAGAIIGSSTDGEGLGQIYRHPYNGLFAYIGNGTAGTGTVNSLTIDGNVNVRDKINGMNIGGIAAVSKGNTSLSGITASQTINYGEPSSVTGSEAAGKNIGGLIGLANGTNNGMIAITGTNTINTTFNISNNFISWNSLGAFIGKVASPKFTINIAQGGSDSLTVSHTMSGTFTAGGNTDGGGLIGYITSIPSTSSNTYSDRKVNIKNLDFNNCTIINKASTNAGGFLGYAWLDTDTTIDGLTVTNGTITNTTPNVGIMCYEATGRWEVNDLTVTKMSLSGGAGTSLGMLVNKAYNGNNGLYLDVLKAGYKLTEKSGDTGITLPNALGVYDELAAYSASKVIQGGNGAGVVSINMNDGRHNPNANPADSYTSKVKITEIGTYQNQLTSASSDALGNTKYANNKSRYYYNLDQMSKSDAEQNIMLWSVNQYAASNINSLFDYTSAPFAFAEETDIALSDYSYYPVYGVSGLTLSNINLEFGYSDIYAVEGNNTFNTDSYNRDPSAQNQHYLMQSGLFINSDEGATLTLNTVEISGDFLENSDYKGVLISGTAKGGISINGLVLDGITPKYNNSGTITNYNTGYLLVNKVNREDAFKANIQINLKEISTSEKYTTNNATSTVARSLFGDVYGPTIGINVEDVKLDARSANGGLTALDSAYGTVNSIFTTATLFNSLKTSQAATMLYNYTWEKDWGTGNRCVTYGREVSESLEYADQENKYYNDTIRYTDPSNNNNTTSEYDFSSWRPYVGTAYTANQTLDSNGCYNRELKVNVPAAAYSAGCGTYNDPYIIDSGAKLKAIAALINDSSKTDELPILQLPKTLYNGVAANTSGARWCDEKNDHAVYEYDSNTGKYKSSESGVTAEWEVENVRLYLANAYYSLSASSDDSNGNIVLSNGYLGLGGTDDSGKFAFRGVIVGNNRTIVNNSQNPLVKVTNGCVLKDLTVNQNVNVNVTAQTNATVAAAYFGYNSACQYYGGMIGEIMGGDNIIDNCYVDFGSTTVTLTGSNGTIVPVGGYVGVVVFGGLIFRNIDASMTTLDQTGLNVVYSNGSTTTTSGVNLASETKVVDNINVKNEEAWAAIYVNPLVGRVINGYAVNETGGSAKDTSGESVDQFSNSEDGKYHDDGSTTRTGTIEHTLKNGKKHYPIADISKSLDKLNVTKVASAGEDGNINVPNAQALFVLSLITQSCAGTAQANTGTATHTENTKETSRITDENDDETVYKTKTVMNITPVGNYTNSLSYGTNTNVFGMSHDATYSSVGVNPVDDPETTNVDESLLKSDDYMNLASWDTSANSAIPYIIRHFTEGTSSVETTIDVSEPEETGGETIPGETLPFTGTVDELDGMEIYIAYIDTNNEKYMQITTTDQGLTAVDSTANAKKLLFTEQSDGKYTITYDDNGTTQYIAFKDNTKRNLVVRNSFFSFTVNKRSDGKWELIGDEVNDPLSGKNREYVGLRNNTHFTGQSKGSQTSLTLYYDTEPTTTPIETTVTTTITTTASHSYPARCVTSSLGYYDISLTGSGTYMLPDSFRGLGCVGNYSANYCMKINEFKGAGCTIDEDIYLSKYQTDNYFNKIHNNTTQAVNTGNDYSVNNEALNHGIGLFDAVKTRSANSTNGIISNFTLTGSVNTEIYDNTYKASSQELALYSSSDAGWLSSGGVVGTGLNESNIVFDQIILDGISVCGSSSVGGIMGYACNKGDFYIEVNRCRTDNDHGLSVKMNSGSAFESNEKGRNAIGGLIGKCFEGKVNIFGTAAKENNSTLSNYSTVRLNSFGFENTTTAIYRCCAGGLVGFAGDGCQAYDMYVVSNNSSSPVTIGGSKINFAGGICGAMQSWKSGTYEKTESGHTKDDIIPDYEPTCFAIFKNCTVDNINIEGQMVGGLYGGKWGTTGWTPYSITVDNCKMVGDSTNKNTIQAVQVYSTEIYAGGFIGRGLVLNDGNPNILIKDSKVSDYNITGNYCGGFLGYAGSFANDTTMTCYIHDSSVENCEIGVNGNNAGGVIGRVDPKVEDANAETANKMLGYNIKLDNVTAGSGAKMGAWIGYLDKGKTSIQFTGIGIYGTGYSNNVGASASGASLTDLSFVFADYGEACASYDTTNNPVSGLNCSDYSSTSTTHVEMPKYPYVNISPQSGLGTGEIISGDGAVLVSTASTTEAYSGKTAEKTMALQIYEDTLLSDTTAANYSRRYTTFSDNEVFDGNGIAEYMKRTTSDEGDRISTWETETGEDLDDVDDFALIFIGNADPVETTNLINRYIQLVTNTTTDYSITSSYYTVVPSACVYNSTSGKFEITNETPSINYTSSASSSYAFTVNSAGADSLSTGKFTLLDVQFKDPLNTNKIAYHLYIPVYVKRSISATFSSTALSGTDAQASSYITYLSTNHRLIENLDNWITAYIRYQYSADDINAILNSGMLDWNGSKRVTLTFSNNATGTSLPAGTQLVLIDPNGNIDKAYYASGSDLSGNTFALSDFHKNYSGGDAFSEQAFCDILDGNVTVTDLTGTENEGTGYYNSGTSSDYDIKIGDDYYSYVSGKTGQYSLTASGAFNEDYYISMLVPSDNNGYVYLFDVQAPQTLSGRMVTYVSNSYHADILLGDLFEQNFPSHTVASTTGAEVINESNNTITVNVTSVVKLKGTDVTKRGFYADYLSGTALYHADVVSFTRHDVSGADNTIYGTDESDISSSGTVDGTPVATSASLSSSYVTVKSGDICSQVIQGASKAEGYDGATITQTIVVTFPGFDEEFPARPEETTYGVGVSVSSNISYDNDGLTYSGKKITYSDGSRYYVENANSATLRYEANDEIDSYDSVGSASYNYSHLGNNGLDRLRTCMWPNNLSGMPISATAKYNAAAVSNYDDAYSIRYTLTLYKKTDVVSAGNITKVEYQQVDIDRYLKNVKVYGGNTTTPLTKNDSSDNQKYVYSELVSAANVDERLFTVGTYYEVVTGGDFHDYANYRVVMEVRLLNSGGATISNSTQKDYIVYTNAKIYPEVID